MKSLKKSPTKAIGSEAIIIQIKKFIQSVSFFKTPINKDLISFLNTINTTIKLPRCKKTLNATGGDIPNNF